VLQEQTVYLQETNDKVEKLAGTFHVSGFLCSEFVANNQPALCVLFFVGILPRVNHIMMSIKGRKWRDLVIMGGFISICICALLLYWLSYRK
jgi:hypothetical protein